MVGVYLYSIVVPINFLIYLAIAVMSYSKDRRVFEVMYRDLKTAAEIVAEAGVAFLLSASFLLLGELVARAVDQEFLLVESDGNAQVLILLEFSAIIPVIFIVLSMAYLPYLTYLKTERGHPILVFLAIVIAQISAFLMLLWLKVRPDTVPTFLVADDFSRGLLVSDPTK